MIFLANEVGTVWKAIICYCLVYLNYSQYRIAQGIQTSPLSA